MSSEKARAVCDTLRTWFCTYGALEELSFDRVSPFDSQEYDSFLKNWRIQKNTSAYNTENNCREQMIVKTATRILTDNMESCVWLCHGRAARALLTQRNTPVQDLGMSSAMMLYGCVTKDHLLVLRDKCQILKQWMETGELREAAIAKRHMRNEHFLQ